MTKAEEKALLLKMEKLLGQAEPDGYIDAAFRGCVGLAYGNIENDWCLSPLEWKEKAERLEGYLSDEKDRGLAYLKEIDSLKQQLADTKNRDTIAIEKSGVKIIELGKENAELKNRVSTLEGETLRLKAELYDLYKANEGLK